MRILCNLPDEIVLKSGVVLSIRTSTWPGNLTSIKNRAKAAKLNYRVIGVLSRNLKGKNDLHGRPYEPSMWLFTNKPLP